MILAASITGLVLALLAAIPLARWMFPLPDLASRNASTARLPPSRTKLATFPGGSDEGFSGKTGIYPLATGTEAFAARMLLIDAAESSLDLQYYRWRGDMTGLIMMGAVVRAADRGVRIRLLLDDNGSAGIDQLLISLEQHPNIEVRLFNPFTVRSPHWAGYFFEFFRLNRRMHNKSFTVDNTISIIGGRNISDAYFETGTDSYFVDLDILAAGDAIQAVSDDFDRYWASESAFPASQLIDRNPIPLNQLHMLIRQHARGTQYQAYANALKALEIVDDLIENRFDLEWVDVALVSDDPGKVLGKAKRQDLMFPQLSVLLGRPSQQVDLITPYLVPGRQGLKQLVQLAKQGVRIRILTNAMEATDVVAVHAGYAKYRKALLKAGIEIHEMRANPSPVSGRSENRLTGANSSSLHAKIFAVDGQRIYVGSFNFDPRSVLLNTEMGFLIESPSSALAMEALFEGGIAQIAYRPFITADGSVNWQELDTDGTSQVHRTEPRTGMLQRALVAAVGRMPIEWLL